MITDESSVDHSDDERDADDYILMVGGGGVMNRKEKKEKRERQDGYFLSVCWLVVREKQKID
jgi:hypothetical protein